MKKLILLLASFTIFYSCTNETSSENLSTTSENDLVYGIDQDDRIYIKIVADRMNGYDEYKLYNSDTNDDYLGSIYEDDEEEQFEVSTWRDENNNLRTTITCQPCDVYSGDNSSGSICDTADSKTFYPYLNGQGGDVLDISDLD